jgi:hypothetical protein
MKTLGGGKKNTVADLLPQLKGGCWDSNLNLEKKQVFLFDPYNIAGHHFHLNQSFLFFKPLFFIGICKLRANIF